MARQVPFAGNVYRRGEKGIGSLQESRKPGMHRYRSAERGLLLLVRTAMLNEACRPDDATFPSGLSERRF